MSDQQQSLTIQQALDLALQHHTAGRLSQAENIYRQILQNDPNQPSALHLLGMIAHYVGKNDQAVDLIIRALAIKPDFAEAHSNLSNALRELGRLDEAVTHCKEALSLKPDYAEAYNNLGNALMDLGKPDEAVASYHKALGLKPDYAEAHYNLGTTFRSLGKPEDAVVSYQKVLDLKPDYAEAHSNLGNALREQGRLKEAVASYHRALDLKPELADAHNNLGIALRSLGKPEEAVASYRKALDLKPDYAAAHSNLGNALKDLGKPDKAVASYHKALDFKPDYADAHNNMGVALQELGKPEDAVASYHKALDLKPNYAEAYSNLGVSLLALGKPGEALTQHRRAISLDPQNDLFWVNFAASLETVSFTSIDDNLYQDLLHLLERPTVQPSFVIRSIISALRHLPDFSVIVEAISADKTDAEFTYSNVAEQLSTIPLFLRILELIPIFDLEIERMLTVLRRFMLKDTIKGKTDDKALLFTAVLAHHCFTNEYVFAETCEEEEIVEDLQRQIAMLMEKGRPVPPSLVVALGAYRPLFGFPWAQELSERKWKEDIESVIRRQIAEPLEERSLRDQIPCLTPIQNTISQAVREQYEENPFPCWVKTELANKSKSLGAVLQDPPLFFDLGDYTSPENPEILIAGCGTGQHALQTTSRFSNAHVLAIDLSLSSLTYAERKTRELGFSNIEYMQGDILDLDRIERRFDLIECGGVLHHLGDPLAGWRVLVDLLRPGGVIKIGLYSETARRHLVAARSLIAEKGYTASPNDIRRYRQDIIALAAKGDPEMAKICKGNSFFSLSECRDLLFHVQEHRFTLPQIEDALTSLNLEFLGFEMQDQGTLEKFRETHTNSKALTSLSLWHEFELENPDTFDGMYQFWCKKS